MPEIVGDGKGSTGSGDTLIAKEWIEVAGAIGAHEDLHGKKILQGETKGVKFDGTVVFANKFSNTT